MCAFTRPLKGGSTSWVQGPFLYLLSATVHSSLERYSHLVTPPPPGRGHYGGTSSEVGLPVTVPKPDTESGLNITVPCFILEPRHY